MNNLVLSLIAAAGMILVALIPVIYWRKKTELEHGWFWAGAGLWATSVALKVVSSLLLSGPLIGYLRENLSHTLTAIVGGLYYGIQSSFFEIGFTLIAVLIWQQLGKNSERAIGVGIGAGSFEALLLAFASIVTTIPYMLGVDIEIELSAVLDATAEATPLFWLVPPAERIIAILCHVASRALVILGVTKRRYILVFWGFLLFTLLDGVAAGFHVYGVVGEISTWWIELTLLPFALISIPIIVWCYKKWKKADKIEAEGL